MSWFTDIFNPPKPMEALCFCVPSAIAAAWSWTVKYRQEVRIAVQNIRKGTDHSQAQGLIDGTWTPLVMFWTAQGPVVRPGKQHFNIEPYEYYTLAEWVDDQIGYTELN